MKLPLLALAALLAGCSAASEQAAAGTYRVDECRSGPSATLALRCSDGYNTTEAHCEGAGGVIVRRSTDGGRTWQCDAKWSDPRVGGELCQHLLCSVDPAAPPDAGRLPIP